MTIKAVLFDFSCTLFRVKQDATWFSSLTDNENRPLSVEARAEIIRKISAPFGQYVTFDSEHQRAWENRDLDHWQSRKAFIRLFRQAGVHHSNQAGAIFDRSNNADEWEPYSDAQAALRIVKSLGCRIGVISNISFDFRPAFVNNGLAEYIDEYLLSYEIGLAKPSLAFFQAAIAKLDVPAECVLVIGDNAGDDGAAQQLGCTFALVEPLPIDERPTGLLDALRAHGISPGQDS